MTPADAAPSPNAQSSLRVLVVDGDPDALAFVRDALHGYAQISEHRSAEAALEALRGEPYDAMPLELALPGMSGLEILRQTSALGRTWPDRRAHLVASGCARRAQGRR